MKTLRPWLTWAVGWALGWVVGWSGVQAQPSRLTGYDLMGESLRQLQRDDAQNPGMLAVREGQALWAQVPGGAGRACASCHGGPLEERMRGVATRYPVWDPATSRPLTLSLQVARCLETHQGKPTLPDSPERLALTAALAHASRGAPLQSSDASLSPASPLQSWRAEGERLWRQRVGQLDLSCAECHEAQVGKRLGGSPIPPANTVGYPTYRLEWQTLGSLQRRLRNCMTGVRAQPYPPDSPQALALEVFMAWRDQGMRLEAPAVRP